MWLCNGVFMLNLLQRFIHSVYRVGFGCGCGRWIWCLNYCMDLHLCRSECTKLHRLHFSLFWNMNRLLRIWKNKQSMINFNSFCWNPYLIWQQNPNKSGEWFTYGGFHVKDTKVLVAEESKTASNYQPQTSHSFFTEEDLSLSLCSFSDRWAMGRVSSLVHWQSTTPSFLGRMDHLANMTPVSVLWYSDGPCTCPLSPEHVHLV